MKKLWIVLIMILILLLTWKAFACETIQVDKLVRAIYFVEGGAHAKFPFGIKSVRCEGYENCRCVCRNTVRNNILRWNKAGCPKDFISFLGTRYAPTSDSPLNKNWIKNVRRIYDKEL